MAILRQRGRDVVQYERVVRGIGYSQVIARAFPVCLDHRI